MYLRRRRLHLLSANPWQREATMTEKITPLVMPKWGLSMKEGKLSAWYVDVGQVLTPGQEILDVETEKIANAVEAVDGGLLRRRIGQVGETYPVKALLGVLAPAEVSEEEIDAYVASFVVPQINEEEEDQGPVYLYVETPSGRLRYVERPGDGDPIMFIHGFGGDLNNWLFNIDTVTGSGPVYALDLPGHGGSAKAIANPGLASLTDAVEQFMAALGLKNAKLIGHSMGGAIAANLALRDDRLVKSLVLISPAGLGEDINSNYIDGFVRAQSRRELKSVLQNLFANAELVSKSMLDDVLKFKRLDGVEAALHGLATAMFRGGKQTDVIADKLATSSIPIQIVWGARDAIIPASHAGALPKAHVEIIAEAGHMAQMEAASRVNELIRDPVGP
jgi:pyruvate dehydrogenase E2 component (dihydrolipoamide acetyltransferase)